MFSVSSLTFVDPSIDLILELTAFRLLINSSFIDKTLSLIDFSNC